MKSISQRIAEELGVREWQVEAAISLLDEGATVPFIARYRKEATGTAMSKTFVKDPRAVAKPGGIVRVKVLDIDPARRRIALTMRLDEPDAEVKSARRPDTEQRDESKRTTSIQQPIKAAPVAPVAIGGAMAEALHRAGSKPGKQGSSGPRTDRRR